MLTIYKNLFAFKDKNKTSLPDQNPFLNFKYLFSFWSL